MKMANLVLCLNFPIGLVGVNRELWAEHSAIWTIIEDTNLEHLQFELHFDAVSQSIVVHSNCNIESKIYKLMLS